MYQGRTAKEKISGKEWRSLRKIYCTNTFTEELATTTTLALLVTEYSHEENQRIRVLLMSDSVFMPIISHITVEPICVAVTDTAELQSAQVTF